MTKILMIIALALFSLGVLAMPASTGEGEKGSSGDSVDERCNEAVVNGNGAEIDTSPNPTESTGAAGAEVN